MSEKSHGTGITRSDTGAESRMSAPLASPAQASLLSSATSIRRLPMARGGESLAFPRLHTLRAFLHYVSISETFNTAASRARCCLYLTTRSATMAATEHLEDIYASELKDLWSANEQ